MMTGNFSPDISTAPARNVAHYTRRVWLLRRLSLGLLGLILLLLAVLMVGNNLDIGVRITGDGRVELHNSRYAGVDSEGRPFSVMAERAWRAEDIEGAVDMASPQGEITLLDNSWMSIYADTGRYVEADKSLTLRDNVTIILDSGYELHLDDLMLDMARSRAYSDKPLNGRGPAGAVTAAGVMIIGKGDVITLTGPARLILRPDKLEALP